jgi:sugar O-acyltransferase (sialic acid O-acetyltransferase NeuD family)
MIIVGAKGFAKEVLEVFHQLGKTSAIAFYDDVNKDVNGFLYEIFPILKNEKQVIDFFFKNGNEFTLGIGNSKLRYKLYKKFIDLGGVFSSTISPFAEIGHYDVQIGVGSNVLTRAILSNSVKVGKGCLIYYNTIITHDCKIGDFVEIAPGVTILGRVEVGAYTQIGANVTILPNLKIGKNVIIGAGSVVTKDIVNDTLVLGVPAKVIK